MRSNTPVTQRRVHIPQDATLMSTTDPDSRVTYANEAFLAVSGFCREELVGEPHNLVRHPDMPEAAFADMWATLRAGLSWSALVKNRSKSGDHYWVRANATPVRRDGRLVGYLSVRTCPGDEEVTQAEAAYQALRGGDAPGMAFHRGLLVHTGWRRWRSWPQTWSTARRLGLAGLLAVAPAAVLAAVLLVGAFGRRAGGDPGLHPLHLLLQWGVRRPLCHLDKTSLKKLFYLSFCYLTLELRLANLALLSPL